MEQKHISNNGASKVKEELSLEEKQIMRIGGALESDYSHFCEVVETVNRSYFPLFDLIGFNRPDDTDIVIEILIGDNIFYGAKQAYIARETKKVESGELKLEEVLSKRLLTQEYSTQEERDKIFKREIHRALTCRYNKLESCYRRKYNYFQTSFHKHPFKICGKTLSLTSDGFKIDGSKFMEIYKNYLEANDSQTGQLHQEAAQAINRFFGGKVAVSERELLRYFVFEDGIMRVNPKSVTIEDYMRLGYRRINK